MMTSMASASDSAVSSAPEFDGILRNRLENMVLKNLAADSGVDPSHLGKFIRGEAALKLSDVSKLVRLADLKAVDRGRTCIDRGLYRFFQRLYRRVEDHASYLIHEDEV